MNQIYIKSIAQRLQVKEWQVENCISLFADGATIPFISRYRKERTGGLNEVQIQEIQSMCEKLEEVEKRKEFVIKSISEQEKLTPELEKRINNCSTLTEIEDIYLPFKPKKRTRAEMAREKGLEPLAKILMSQNERDPENRAIAFVKPSPRLFGRIYSGFLRTVYTLSLHKNSNSTKVSVSASAYLERSIESSRISPLGLSYKA
jgi:uncharacterized protein